jgi:tripartite motif-containing protein 2/3
VAGASSASPPDTVSAASPPRPLALRFERAFGQSGTGPAEFYRPGGLAATPVGGILVADTGNVRVQHLTRTGEMHWEAGGLGTDEGAMGRPTAVAPAAGLDYLVLDSLGGAILQFHARGEYLGVAVNLAAGSLVDRLGEVEARGLAVDRSGGVLVSDRDGDRLLVFASDWAFQYQVGGFGDDAQSFEDPEGVAVARNRIFVADSMNGRVQVLDELGSFVDAWPLPGGGMPLAVAADRHGNVFVADAGHSRVVAFTSDGSLACTVGAAGDGLGSFRRPSGICVVEDRLVVADADLDRLQVFEIRYSRDR